MIQEVNPTRGFEIRTIQDGQVLGCKGFGLEIINGGQRGHQNRLVVGRGNYGSDEAYAEEAGMRCWPGNRLISTFDYIRMAPSPNLADPGNPDTVTVKIKTVRNAVFVDAPPASMTRRRGLVRNLSGVIPTLTTSLLYDSNPTNAALPISSDQFPDKYSFESRLTDEGYLDGWIAGDQTFEVWLLAARAQSANFPAEFRPLIKATARNRLTIPTFTAGTSTFAGAYSFTFDYQDSATISFPWRLPGTPYQIHVYNTSGANLQVSYAIGVRGSI